MLFLIGRCRGRRNVIPCTTLLPVQICSYVLVDQRDQSEVKSRSTLPVNKQEGSEISVRLECQSADGVHQDQDRQVEPMPTVTDRSSIIPVEYMRTIFKPRP